jgi:hypothetical protein
MNASSSLALTLIQSSDRRPEAEHPEQQRPERGGVLVLNRVEPIPIEEAQANVDANWDTNTQIPTRHDLRNAAPFAFSRKELGTCFDAMADG